MKRIKKHKTISLAVVDHAAKIKELNETMDKALEGVMAGYLQLDTLIRRYVVDHASTIKLDVLHAMVTDHASLGRTIELLSRPVTEHKDGTLYYKGGNR